MRTEFVDAALAALDGVTTPAPQASPQAAPRAEPPSRVLLFTGHMLDASDRQVSRFPRTPAAEAAARQMILESINKECQLGAGRIVGVAGGACGGDILFHELCEQLGIETRLLLALPEGKFCAASVQHGGSDWVERYNRLVRPGVAACAGRRQDTAALASPKADYEHLVAQQLVDAVQCARARREESDADRAVGRRAADGPGGTAHLVKLVTTYGHKVDRLPAELLKQ